MALGSGSITFSQIAQEWGLLALPGQVTYDTNTPLSMREFLKGAAINIPGYGPDPSGFVPVNYNTTDSIPSTGNLSMSSLKNTLSEANGVACVGEWYTNRTYYTRTWITPNANPFSPYGIYNNNQYSNDHQNRRTTSWNASYTYAQPGTAVKGYSKYSTLLDWVIGSNHTVTAWAGQYTDSTNFYSTSWKTTWIEQTMILSQARYMARNWTNTAISYNRQYANSGAWNGQYLLPGKWIAYNNILNPVHGVASHPQYGVDEYYSEYPHVVTVPAGFAYFLTVYAGNDDRNLLTTYGHTAVTTTTGEAPHITAGWWYNSYVTLFWANTTNSSQQLSIPDAYSKVYYQPDKNSPSVFQGFTSRGMFYNSHQEFYLQRTS